MKIESLTTLDAILVSHARESPAHRFLLRPEQDSVDSVVQEVTYSAFDAHVSRLARTWITKQAKGDLEGSPIRPRAVVGVFLPSGYTLCAVLFALLRLGAVPFCLSPRNSDEALKHLVRTGDVVAIVAATDGALASRIKAVLEDEGDLRVPPILEVARAFLADLPSGTELYKMSYPSLPSGVATGLDIAIQQHTSGSTAFPKPVPLSNEVLLRSLQGGTWWVDGLHSQSDITLGQPAIFHIMGLVGGLLNALFRGHTFAIPPLPPTDNGGVPSSQTLRAYALRVHATEFFGASSAVVGLARSDGGLDLLKTMKRVLVGGAPMPRENGDWIVQHGVHLVEGVGSTEGGSLLHSNRRVGDPAWQAMQVCWNVSHHFEPFGPAPQTVHELILHSSTRSGQFPGADPKTGHFNTHDLFQEWPRPGRRTWRHCGRSDDVLLLSSGQNWNPRPMELQIEASPAIQHAVIFGHARPYLGVLIAPRGPRGPGSLVHELKDDEKETVWSAVQVANAIVPSGAYIARNCVLLVTVQGVLPLNSDTKSSDIGLGVKHIPIADKGTPLRSKTYALFKKEIDLVYNGAF